MAAVTTQKDGCGRRFLDAHGHELVCMSYRHGDHRWFLVPCAAGRAAA